MRVVANGRCIHLSLPLIEDVKAVGTFHYHASIDAVRAIRRELFGWNSDFRLQCGGCESDERGEVKVVGRGKCLIGEVLREIAWRIEGR